MSGLPARTGWAWLKEGAALLRQQPGALIFLLLTNMLVSGVLSRIPVLGPVLLSALIPALSLAFMRACLMIQHGQRVPPAVLLTGLHKPAVFNLMKIGLLYLLAIAVLAGLSRLFVSAEFIAQFQPPFDPAKRPEGRLVDTLIVLLMSILSMGVVLVVSYAAPLIYWQKMAVGKSLFYSFFGVMRSLRAFLILLLSWCGIFMTFLLITQLLLGAGKLGFLVTSTVLILGVILMQCALYCGYRQIFGVPDADVAPGSVK
ncbi:MAG: BPSS1780 family membrane protein [Massilia sp.]